MRISLIILVLVAFTQVGCATSVSTQALDEKIDLKKKEIAEISKQLHEASGEAFQATHDLQATVRYRFISQWLMEISNPSFTISGIGQRAYGDVIYVPRIGKAWIDPPNHTKIKMMLKRFSLMGNNFGASWSCRLEGHSESRLHTHIFNIGGNVLCEGDLDEMAVFGNVVFGKVTQFKVPYVINLTRPPGTTINAVCHLGALGDVHQAFPVNDLAKKVSEGTFDIGFTSQGQVIVPLTPSGATYNYRISAKEAQFISRPDAFEYRANLDVVIQPQ